MGENNNIIYGLGYQGSKNAIAWQIVNRLPSNDTLVDLFCGGGAITHCAMAPHNRLQPNYGRFKNYIMNDVNPLVVKAIKMAFNGEFKKETRWISKKDFEKLKDTDPYVAICFSFGNNLTSYMYNDNIEKYKKAWHYAVMFNNWALFRKLFSKEVYTESREITEGITDTHERRTRIMSILRKHKVKVNVRKKTRLQLQSLERLPSLESLERLQSLERLERLQSLERLQRVKYYSTDYRNVPIPPNSTVYCDIPYKGTNEYKAVDAFDHDAFYEWALSRDFPVFVSEYNMPDTFTCLYRVKKNAIFSQKGTAGKKDEGLYVQNKFAKLYENPTKYKEVDMFTQLEKRG